MVVREKLFVSIAFPTCVSIPIFQKFEMGLKKFRNFENKNYRGEKVLELPETCKSTKIFFGHSIKKLRNISLAPFAPVQPRHSASNSIGTLYLTSTGSPKYFHI
jgi:hypothetical protein